VAEGKAVPSEVAARVREQAQRIREEIFQKHGIVDLGVPTIRERRGELPES
jgi:hypothetical protein